MKNSDNWRKSSCETYSSLSVGHVTSFLHSKSHKPRVVVRTRSQTCNIRAAATTLDKEAELVADVEAADPQTLE